MVRLNPIHKFSILSLICILILILSLGTVVSYYFKKIMLNREGRITTDFVQVHAKAWLTTADFNLPPAEDQHERFDRVFQNIAKMPEVVGLKVYDKNGIILWSDREVFIGQRHSENKELQRAIKNREPVVVLEVMRRADHTYLKKYHHDLLEVYVPVSFDSNLHISGVVAAYKTSTPLLEDIRAGKIVIWLVSTAGGALLYISLFGIFYRAHKTEKQMTEGIQRLNQELSIFNKIAVTLSRHLEMDSLLNETLDAALEVMNMKTGWILLMDEEKGELLLTAHKGLSADTVNSFKPIKVGEAIAGEVVRTGNPVILAKLSEEPKCGITSQNGEGMKPYASIPLKSMDRVVGVMEVMCSAEDCELPMESYSLFSAIGHQIGAAISKSMLYKEVKTFKERLEDMVEEKTRQVIQMEKLSALGELMGEIAHQINNPLVGVVNFAQLALKEMDDNHPLRGEIETIKRAGMECREIIQRMLTFSRQSSFEKIPTDVNLLIEEALGLIERQFSLEKIIIEKRYDKTVMLTLDPVLMRQVFFNIINNAREAMRGGGKLTITTFIINNSVNINISDTGAGINKENLKKIFSPFFTTKAKEGGVGLGLAVVRDIVNRHNGEVRMESEEGAGTTFNIRMPVES